VPGVGEAPCGEGAWGGAPCCGAACCGGVCWGGLCWSCCWARGCDAREEIPRASTADDKPAQTM